MATATNGECGCPICRRTILFSSRQLRIQQIARTPLRPGPSKPESRVHARRAMNQAGADNFADDPGLVESSTTAPETLTEPLQYAPRQTHLPPAPAAAASCSASPCRSIVSQSFMTVQVFVDTILLSWHDPLEMAGVVPGGDVVLAALRPAAGDRRVHVHVRRPVHRGEPAGTRRPGGLAGNSLSRSSPGLLFLVDGPGRSLFLIALGGHPASNSAARRRPICNVWSSRRCRCSSWPR